MVGKENFVGRVFDRLTVISRAENRLIGKLKQLKPYWLCRCSCKGKLIEVSGAHLRNGWSKSCGCIRAEKTALWNVKQKGIPNFKNRKSNGVAARNDLLRRYKASASVRDYTWELTEDEFDSLVKSNCYFCGFPPSRVIKRAGGDFVYNGIDRLENEPYYRIYNSVSCCWDYNSRKRAWDSKRFILWATRVSEYRKAVDDRSKDREFVGVG